MINKKLAEISMVMSDGYDFLKLRFFLESFENSEDQMHKDVIKMVEQFHRLCMACKEGKLG